MRGGAMRWRRMAEKIGVLFPCISGEVPPRRITAAISNLALSTSPVLSERDREEEICSSPSKQNLCAICLEPLLLGEPAGGRSSPEIFTSTCQHPFHFNCIISDARHGRLTCPICRSRYPPHIKLRLLSASRLPPPPQTPPFADPFLLILEGSIDISRIHRHSSGRFARFDLDDGPADRIRFRLTPAPSHLLVRLSSPPPIDIVLVATPSESYLRQLRQAVALTVLLLRPIDRLAIVASGVFDLHLMSSRGKRAALLAIDRLLCVGQADPKEGLRTAAKILEDFPHLNPHSCVLQFCENRPQSSSSSERLWFFDVESGFGGSGGSVGMTKFEKFLTKVMGDEVGGLKLRIGDGGNVVGIGNLRCGEERKIPVGLIGDSDAAVSVGYEYGEWGGKGAAVSGNIVLELEQRR